MLCRESHTLSVSFHVPYLSYTILFEEILIFFLIFPQKNINIINCKNSWNLTKSTQLKSFYIQKGKLDIFIFIIYFYCQHILSCPSRCHAGKWEEAKMLWNSIFADLCCLLLRSQFCSDRLQNRILASFSPGLTRVMSLLRKFREAERKKADLSPFYFVSKMNVTATRVDVSAG